MGASSTAKARVKASMAPQTPAATTHPFWGRKPITPLVRIIEPVDLICLEAYFATVSEPQNRVSTDPAHAHR